MGISSALHAATTGLSVNSRLAELVSTNIANASTPGYVRRDAELSPIVLGGAGSGVTISGIRRTVDVHLMNDRRGADAAASGHDTVATFLSDIESVLGNQSSGSSLTAKISAFDSALLAATSRPDSDSYLEGVLTSAKQLVTHLGISANRVQSERTNADAAIASDVRQLNGTLSQIEQLNNQIKSAHVSGRDTTSLEELRQAQIDSISGILPIRQVERENGVVSLFTTGGAALLDGKASQFGFEQTRFIDAGMSLQNGALSGLTLNGQAMQTGDTSLLAGGSLIASFAVRDKIAPNVQSDLDSMARDLVERFSVPGLDATRAAGAPGFFTDNGSAFSSANENGLAQRLAINAVADPAAGGELWRVRDGLGAAVSGPAGESGLLSAMRDALTSSRTASSGGAAGKQYSFATLTSELVSSVATQRIEAEEQTSFARARSTGLAEKEQVSGVDTDHELQKMLLIEQSYAANARVIQALDAMLQSLLEI